VCRLLVQAAAVLERQQGKHASWISLSRTAGHAGRDAGVAKGAGACRHAKGFRWHDQRHRASWHAQDAHYYVLQELGGWASAESVSDLVYSKPTSKARLCSLPYGHRPSVGVFGRDSPDC
jgi:hypothetical protein